MKAKQIIAGLVIAAQAALPAAIAEKTDIPERLTAPVTAAIQEAAGKPDADSIVSTYSDRSGYAASKEALPSGYDLRELGLVTPVKLQYPFGTCWAFGAIAACETSILSKLGLTYDEFLETYGFEMDLSERQTAYFVHHHLPEESEEDYAGQNGEGCYFVNDFLNIEMTGGNAFEAGEFFSDGIGPSFEFRMPYRGKEGLMSDQTTSRGSLVHCYTEEDDWSLPEEDRFYRDFDLIECNELICPAVMQADAYSYDPAGTDSIKRAILQGKAVAIGFHADNSMPGKPTDFAYMNVSGDDPTWAHYTYDPVAANHEVCIVGWDDQYPASNFNADHMPPADGAWICKNSWGSVNAENVANYCDWGYEGSGYFYLSYYDKSLSIPNTFEFDVSKFLGEYTTIYIDQYDLTTSAIPTTVTYETPVSAVNIFTADGNGMLTAVSVDTDALNEHVSYQIYRMNTDSADPRDGILIEEGETSIPYAGYHKISLREPARLIEGERYAVVTEITCTDVSGATVYKIPVNFAADEEINREAIPDEDAEYFLEYLCYQKAVVNPGESFIIGDNICVDWFDIINAVRTESGPCAHITPDNFAIKAYIIPE